MNVETKTAQSVQELLQTGDFEQALKLAKEILNAEPEDVYCLSVVAQSEFSQGLLNEAKETLIKAHQVNSTDLNINRNLGLICNKQGDFEESTAYYLASLESNKEHPGILLDYLLMGISLSKISNKLGVKVISWVFSNSQVLMNAYQNNEELPVIREASSIGNALVRDFKYSKQKNAIDELALGFEDSEKTRMNQFLDVFHGIQAPKYVDQKQRPTYHVFPDLKPYPFYDADDFGWTQLLEQNYLEIKDEVLALYQNQDSIKPYIENAKTGNHGLDELADSLDWSSVHLIKGGDYKQDLLDQCPKTKKILAQLPLPALAGNGPEVFLSVLKAGAEIKPHYGLSNIKLTVHLGLDVPEDCGLRAGSETQAWENGKVMIFDDSFEHEAWNRSDKDRYVLILEVWHPDLSELERKGIQKIQELQHKFTVKAAAESYESLIEKVKKKLLK